MSEDLKLAEEMRQRDVLVQVERFLKYAPKGTAPDALRAEAALWAERLAGFEGANAGKASALRQKLAKLAG